MIATSQLIGESKYQTCRIPKQIDDRNYGRIYIISPRIIGKLHLKFKSIKVNPGALAHEMNVHRLAYEAGLDVAEPIAYDKIYKTPTGVQEDAFIMQYLSGQSGRQLKKRGLFAARDRAYELAMKEIEKAKGLGFIVGSDAQNNDNFILMQNNTVKLLDLEEWSHESIPLENFNPDTGKSSPYIDPWEVFK